MTGGTRTGRLINIDLREVEDHGALDKLVHMLRASRPVWRPGESVSLNYFIQAEQAQAGISALFEKMKHLLKRCAVCGRERDRDWEAYVSDERGEGLCFECGLWALGFDTWDEDLELRKSAEFWCSIGTGTQRDVPCAPPSDAVVDFIMFGRRRHATERTGDSVQIVRATAPQVRR